MTTEMSAFARDVYLSKYAMTKRGGGREEWGDTARRVARNVFGAVDASPELVKEFTQLIIDRRVIPGGRYLYAAGRKLHQTQNCLMTRVEDSREGWADHNHKAAMCLMTGAGLGTDYSLLREKGAPIRRTGGTASGPCSLIKITNEAGREYRQGGGRRSAIWAGLSWKHPDIFEFIHLKDWPSEVRALKAKNRDFPATCDGTNISVQLDDDFFRAYDDKDHALHGRARKVYWEVVNQMLRTGEPGFSVDVGLNRRDTLRNACTEVVSADDSDICNLGSINLARIHSLEEMRHVVDLTVALLIAGTEYSHVPYERVAQVREKNRRLGLGLMGIHEWLLTHGKKYGPDDDLAEYLKVYAESTKVARRWCDEWDLSPSIATRAIAPVGTIGIIGETTTGIEPIFCVAYKRRYLKGEVHQYQYVVDPTAKRLIESGVSPDAVEDAYSLAGDVERRVAFQAWIQTFVDQGISSTINLPSWGSELNNEGRVRSFGNMLLKYLPRLRGITCYPDGARGGQPLTPVAYATALKHVGEIFVEAADVCEIGRGGSCGA